MLTRANGAVLVVPLALGAWTARPRWSWRALAAPATIVAVAALVVAPWTVRNALVLHAAVPVSTDLGPTLAGTYDARSSACRYLWRAPHLAQLPPDGVAVHPADRQLPDQDGAGLGL